MTKYFYRDISSTIIHALGELPVIVITGMRQSGNRDWGQVYTLHRGFIVFFKPFYPFGYFLGKLVSHETHIANHNKKDKST